MRRQEARFTLAIFVTARPSGAWAFPVRADLSCGEATFECVEVDTGYQKSDEDLMPQSFCTLVENRSHEELLAKLKFYELCNYRNGMVIIGKRNK